MNEVKSGYLFSQQPKTVDVLVLSHRVDRPLAISLLCCLFLQREAFEAETPQKKKKGYGSMCRLHVYRFISLPHNHTGTQVGSLTGRERQRVKGSNKGGSRDWWGRRGEEERQTLEIVGVLEKRRVWNERVNLQGNRLAFEPSFSVLQSRAQIQHSETHMLYLSHTHTHAQILSWTSTCKGNLIYCETAHAKM